MDVLQFYSSIINGLAWPVVVLTIAVLFRKSLAGLLPLLEKLKYKDFELEFGKSVREMAENSRAQIGTLDNEVATEIGSNKLFQLAEVSPRSAILEAWLLVETAAAEKLTQVDPEMSKKTHMVASLRLAEYLNRKEIINGSQLETFHRLRDLRNKAVHVGDTIFQTYEVFEYINLALLLSSQIRKGSYN